MTVVGTTVRYVSADGKRVTAVAYEEQWNQPRYSVEGGDGGRPSGRPPIFLLSRRYARREDARDWGSRLSRLASV